MKYLLMTLLVLAAPAMAQEFDDPAVTLRAVGDAITSDLSANMERYRVEPVLLEDLVRAELLPVMDTEYSARLILGRAGRGASPQQIEDFGNSITSQLINRYAKGLLEYREREQIEVLPTRGNINPRATRVRTRVRLLNGTHVPVDYVCRMTEAGWRVFDVIVEGISYVQTYRNQIMPQVEEIGLDKVIAGLNSGELKIAE